VVEFRRNRGLKSSWEWLEYAAGLPARHVAMPGPTNWGQVVGGANLLMGATIANASGAAVTVTIRDGADVSGDPMAVLVVPANSGLPWAGPASGIMAEIGIFIASPGASVTGVVHYIPLEHEQRTPPGE
jgi:hypothetical protein